MTVFISNQQITAGSFKRWILRKLGVQYELETPEEKPEAEEEIIPTIVEPVVDPADIVPLMLWDAIQELPTRVHNTIIGVTHFKKLSLTKTTLEEFTEKVTELDLLKVPGCGSKTIEKIREWLAEYELELRKDDTL